LPQVIPIGQFFYTSTSLTPGFQLHTQALIWTCHKGQSWNATSPLVKTRERFHLHVVPHFVTILLRQKGFNLHLVPRFDEFPPCHWQPWSSFFQELHRTLPIITVAGLNLPRRAELFHDDEPLINTRKRFKSQQFFGSQMLPTTFPQINFISLSYFWLTSQFSLWRCDIGWHESSYNYIPNSFSSALRIWEEGNGFTSQILSQNIPPSLTQWLANQILPWIAVYPAQEMHNQLYLCYSGVLCGSTEDIH
jgi:hypothetical protein